MHNRKEILEMAAEIVAAYVAANTLPAHELPNLTSSVYSTLLSLDGSATATPKVELTPAVPVKKSVTPDYIICLEDGKKFKSLRRHIMSKYNLTPEAYRAKWNLPSDYPMVAPNYAKERSELAKRMGLGKKRVVRAKPKPDKKRRASPKDSNPG